MVRAILGVAALALVLVGPLVYAGPQLASDLAAGKQWAPADELAIKSSKCKRWYFLVSTCNVEYVNRVGRDRVGDTLHYLVFGSWSGERVALLRSIKNPKQVGTTLGLEHMQQRVVSFAVFVALALAFLFGFVVLAVRWPTHHHKLPTPNGIRTFGRRTGESTA